MLKSPSYLKTSSPRALHSASVFERYAKICSSKLLKIASKEASHIQVIEEIWSCYSHAISTINSRINEANFKSTVENTPRDTKTLTAANNAMELIQCTHLFALEYSTSLSQIRYKQKYNENVAWIREEHESIMVRLANECATNINNIVRNSGL